ncbi:hypothetical protein ACFXGT_09950 [Streptomyces sp. NPDC059352]|uniref:hypothetical protein n=1 Tax=Streptomyces sp. NPDC059352 TaxID=3346810 RepID=UPI0036C01DCF
MFVATGVTDPSRKPSVTAYTTPPATSTSSATTVAISGFRFPPKRRRRGCGAMGV